MTESLQPGIYACLLVMLPLATLTLGLRFYARRIKRLRPWWDDYLAVVSYVRREIPPDVFQRPLLTGREV